MAIYLINRCPNRTNAYNTLEKIYKRERPLIMHFRIFGFQVYVHISKVQHKKLQLRSHRCMLLRYDSNTKNIDYKIYLVK